MESRVRSYSAFAQVNSVIGVGVPSAHTDIEEIYFIGIVDFLARYYIKKKSANLMKRQIWSENMLSTIPPDKYCKRFCDYIPTVIAQPEIKNNRYSVSENHKVNLKHQSQSCSTQSSAAKMAKMITPRNKTTKVSPEIPTRGLLLDEKKQANSANAHDVRITDYEN